MISALSGAGIDVPQGFATTADAYREFVASIADQINAELDNLDVDNVDALTTAGAKIRQWVMESPLPAGLEQAVREAYAELSNANPDAAVAVRSSATAEDLRPAVAG